MQFNSVQIGLDIATSLAILASAVTFLINQKRKNDQAKVQQLDTSVRTVATEQLQSALHTLSRRFINEVVNTLNMPSNALGGDLEQIERRFAQRDGLPSRLLDQFSEANDALSAFVDEVHAYKYQLYPLLDTLGNGQKEIAEFKAQLGELITLFNEINTSATPLARELERVLAFCVRHPFDDLDEAQTAELLRLAGSIMLDRDYAYWVNSFIADEDEAAYWGEGGAQHAVRVRATQNFIAYAYEHPNRLRAQVFARVYLRYQTGRTMCKKFLIMLAAINHTLLCREGTAAAEESPSATAHRYAGEAFFALEREVR
ncbi:hypothetical protein [Diaphorobacter nitroreducens]|uniref:hypothetical protein n=1 Tax=Diaphorobacter nitroreducens TaxID=164759 RepID=UPI0028A8A104|nr:hypothetical protein [Diaphorobacter nitroreducens]